MKKVAIVPYVRKPGVKDILSRVVTWLEGHNVDINIPHIEADEVGLERYAVADDSLFEGVDVAVALGGDGTTLRALRLMGDDTVPVLGVNLGEIGFLMWVSPDEIEDALERVLTGDFRVEERHMLEADIRFDDDRRITRLALNDILVGREEFSRLIKVDVMIDGRHFCTYAADGVLVNTPTGSTAYSFSAGGPVISPSADVFAMVPICPHSPNNTAHIFSAAQRLSLRPVLTETISRAGVSVDGVTLRDLGRVAQVDVRLSDTRFKFISLNGPDFYQSLGDKLKGWLGL